MKLARFVVPVLLLLVAAPSFAICGFCDFNCTCTSAPGSGSRCKPTIDCCTEVPAACEMANQPTPMLFASDFSIASVEVVTPAKHAVTTAQPRLAERSPQPASHTR